MTGSPGLVFPGPGRARGQVRLERGERNGIAWVRMGTRSSKPSGLVRRLERAGLPPPAGGGRVGVWSRDPGGVPVHLELAEPPRRW